MPDADLRVGAGLAPAGLAAVREPPPVRRRRWLRPLLLVVVPLVALVAVGLMVLAGGRYVSTDNAYVKAEKMAVTTDVAGVVAEVLVRDNQRVDAGQALFRLDDEPFRIAQARADAQLGVIQVELESTRATYRDKLQAIARGENDVQYFDREYQRQSELARRDFASRTQQDKARLDLDRARRDVASLRQQLAAITATLGGSPDLPVEEHPRWRAALADRDQAARELRRTLVTAPSAGIVTQVDKLRPGQYLTAGQPAFMLVDADHVWIEANPKETDLTWVRVGQAVAVAVDSYPGETWTGTVESVSPASGAEFALLPAQNTSGNWVKVVQRIPLRIRVDPGPDQPPLRAGMSAVVDIDTGRQRTLAGLIQSTLGREPR